MKQYKNFKIIGTTADVAVEAYGESLQYLFAHAAEGLVYILTDPGKIDKKETRKIELEGTDLENLMVKWLNEILYIFEVKNFLGGEFRVHEVDKNILRAEIKGEAFKKRKHLIKTEIKAVTYHQLALIQQKGQWKAKIIFDL